MPVDEFNDIYLTPLLKKITFENKNIILTGDFNINLLNTETDEPTSSFLKNLASNLFIPHIILPTRITTRSKTLIDNIFSNSLNSSYISGNITTSILIIYRNFYLYLILTSKTCYQSTTTYSKETQLILKKKILSLIY